MWFIKRTKRLTRTQRNQRTQIARKYAVMARNRLIEEYRTGAIDWLTSWRNYYGKHNERELENRGNTVINWLRWCSRRQFVQWCEVLIGCQNNAWEAYQLCK